MQTWLMFIAGTLVGSGATMIALALTTRYAVGSILP